MKRTEQEQLEFQRRNPHLFTTMTQSVNPDGSIVSFFDVTAKLREQRDKVAELITEHDSSPQHFLDDGCIEQPTEMLTYILGELKKCQHGFIENFERMHRRHGPNQSGYETH